MLDFYFISDELPADYALTQAEYAGGIKMREFEQAQHAHVIGYELDFFDDFRWSSSRVKQKLAQLSSNHSDQFTSLMHILRRAEELNCGVMAFGD